MAEKNQRDLQTQREQAERHVGFSFLVFFLKKMFHAERVHSIYVFIYKNMQICHCDYLLPNFTFAWISEDC